MVAVERRTVALNAFEAFQLLPITCTLALRHRDSRLVITRVHTPHGAKWSNWSTSLSAQMAQMAGGVDSEHAAQHCNCGIPNLLVEVLGCPLCSPLLGFVGYTNLLLICYSYSFISWLLSCYSLYFVGHFSVSFYTTFIYLCPRSIKLLLQHLIHS